MAFLRCRPGMLATLILMAVPALAAPAAPPKPPPTAAARPLSGNWGGDGFVLRVITDGAMVQGKCANGKITAPVMLTPGGQFVASGYFNPVRSGYRLTDLSPRDMPARFTGQVKGDTLELTLESGLFASPQRYRLKRGKTVKFTDCG